ncbi:uncharacterized protein LOC141637308 [Silene latifolia]|uniref:uncharacterized protein LOC141637308 n=1 Tax=Silene latifolia TaxID=37657 RepID=UPI003D7706C5
MKVASWNVRGSNDPLKLQEIHDFLRVNNLDMLGILETKTKKRVSGTVLRSYFGSYHFLCNYDHLNQGRIWLLWKSSTVVVTPLIVHSQFIHCKVSHNASNQLDRAMANVQWFTQFPAASANFLSSGISDHSPVVVTIFDDVKNRTRFSFLNCWLEHPNYHSLVQEAWAIPVSGSSTFKLFASLKNVKTALKSLHGDHFSGISTKVKGLKQELQDCQLLLQATPLSKELISKEKDLMLLYCKYKRIETSIFQQKAKVNNIAHGDCSSTFFFAKIQERAQQQIIGQITDRKGQLQLGLPNVAASFVDYYEHLLGASTDIMPLDACYIQQGPCINSDDAADLVLPISTGEIRSALFDIGSDKSLDLMGSFLHSSKAVGTWSKSLSVKLFNLFSPLVE